MDNGNIQSSQIRSQQKLGEPYLKIRLDETTIIAIPMKQAQEVIIVNNDRITPIPNMSHNILGLLNQRSRVFWVVDLAQMLGLKPIKRDIKQYNVAIIKANKIPLGLIVKEVTGVIRITKESIQSPLETFTSSITSYLTGCVFNEEGIVLVLDAEAIIEAPIIHN